MMKELQDPAVVAKVAPIQAAALMQKVLEDDAELSAISREGTRQY